MSEYFFPKLNAVEAMAPYRLRTTWSTGEVLEVDVESVLRKHAFLAAICPPAGQDQPVNPDRRGRSLSEEPPGVGCGHDARLGPGRGPNQSSIECIFCPTSARTAVDQPNISIPVIASKPPNPSQGSGSL